LKLQSLYISQLEFESGAVIISYGLMAMLKRKYKKVAFFRPIVSYVPNNDIELIIHNFKLNMHPKECIGITSDEAKKLISTNQQNKLYEQLIAHYEKLKENHDFVLIQGVSKDSLDIDLDFDINLELAKNFDTPVIALLNGKDKPKEEILEDISIEAGTIKSHGVNHFATFVNRVNPQNIKEIESTKTPYLLYCIEEVPAISNITIADIQETLDAKIIIGDKKDLHKTISHIKVGAMNFDNYLEYIDDKDLIIVPADRSDIIIGSIAAIHSKTVPNISCILLTGNIKLNKYIKELLKGFNEHIPILKVKESTFEIAKKVSNVKAIIRAGDNAKTSLIEGVFNNSVDLETIEQHLQIDSPHIITPVMFEYNLLKRARENKQTIVLPEAKDERILKASEILLNGDVADIVLLGEEHDILRRANLLGVDISKATIIEPSNCTYIDNMAQEFYELRKHKGLTLEQALEMLQTNNNYFATMMVHMGYAGGMVSGSISTTADTVRPALQIIKTTKDAPIVSSVFFMCLDTKVLVYGDCAINLDPTAEELAVIAKSSIKTARAFGIDPKVAMLSYSTGQSGSGADVEKVKEATKILHEDKSLLVEGPIQYDAAIEKSVAASKLPNSKVAGEANVLIFPDLNTGNNTYKAVQRSSGAIAIGPVLQGLNKPINDLSRGCLVSDIVNTIAITAIQAGDSENKKGKK
jgi:phosphate acetyltransferase